jgi:hypothetical protein
MSCTYCNSLALILQTDFSITVNKSCINNNTNHLSIPPSDLNQTAVLQYVITKQAKDI